VTRITVGLREPQHVHCESLVAVKGAIVSPNDLESESKLIPAKDKDLAIHTFDPPILCFFEGRGMSVVAIRIDLDASLSADDVCRINIVSCVYLPASASVFY
jgi:hypothetical protein